MAVVDDRSTLTGGGNEEEAVNEEESSQESVIADSYQTEYDAIMADPSNIDPDTGELNAKGEAEVEALNAAYEDEMSNYDIPITAMPNWNDEKYSSIEDPMMRQMEYFKDMQQSLQSYELAMNTTKMIHSFIKSVSQAIGQL